MNKQSDLFSADSDVVLGNAAASTSRKDRCIPTKHSLPAASRSSNGFQRGFLLSGNDPAKDARRKRREQTPIDVPAPEVPATKTGTKPKPSALFLEEFPTTEVDPTRNPETPTPEFLEKTAALTDSKSNSCKDPSATRPGIKKASETNKKDSSGWTKGFLTKNTSTSGKIDVYKAKKKKQTTTRKPKDSIAPTSIAPKKKKDSGWAKGFLTNNNNTKKKSNNTITQKNANYDTMQGTKRGKRSTMTDEEAVPLSVPSAQTPISASIPCNKKESNVKNKRTTRSCELLLSIDNDQHERDNGGKSCNIIGTQAMASIPQTTIASQKAKLVTAGSKKPLISILSEETTDTCNQNVTGTLTSAPREEQRSELSTPALVTESLVLPLISVPGRTQDDKETPSSSSSLFLKEVSTTRKTGHEEVRKGGILHAAKKDHVQVSSASKNEIDNNGFVGNFCQTFTGSTNDEENEDPSVATEAPIHAGGGILKFQQGLERQFLRRQHLRKREDGSASNDNGDEQLQMLGMRSWTLEHRRCAWIYLLQRKQHRQQRRQQHEQKKTIDVGSKGSTSVLEKWFSELLDADYCDVIYQQQNGANQDDKTPLESILQCYETEEERRMAFEGVLVVREHFSQLYRVVEGGNESSSALTRKPTTMNAIPRLVPLVVQLVRSAGNRRTRLAQSAWDTSILLIALHIRECGPSVQTLSSSSLTCPLSRNLGVDCLWEQLVLILQQQLVWQQSKKKHTNTTVKKTKHLQELERKTKNIVGIVDPDQENTASLSLLLSDIFNDLDTILEM